MARTPSHRVIILTALLGSACNTQSPDSLYEGPAFGRVAGFVTSVEGAPLADIEVSVQGLTAFTDANGMYVIDGVEPGNDLLVEFDSEDHARTYARTSLISWETVHVDKALAEIDGVGTFNASTGGVVTVGDVTIDFEPNGIVFPDGTHYSGLVNVEVTFIDPYTDELLAAPGDLTALMRDPDGGSKAVSTPGNLVSYGMLQVELTTEDDEEVNLSEETPALVEMPIAQDGLATVYQMTDGDSQKSWHFDTSNGRWTEVGEGLVGLNEEGNLKFSFEAPHFSWWNCDQGFVPTCATGRVVDVLGFPVRGAQVVARGGQSTSTVTTDSEGYYVASVLAGDTVTFTGSTYVSQRAWRNSRTNFINGGATRNECQNIEPIQIDVCREAGVVMVENLELHVSAVDEAANGDQMRAWFFDPMGDPEMCRSPWEELDVGDCMQTTPKDFPTHLAGEFPTGSDLNTRSVGNWVDVSTDRSRYRMDKDTHTDGKPRYFFETLEISEQNELITNDIDLRGGDRLDVRIPGNPSDYWGAMDEQDWVTIPEAVNVSNMRGAQANVNRSGGMDIRFNAENNDYGMLLFAVSGPDEDCLVCRFADNGNIRLSGAQLTQLPAAYTTMSVYRPEFSWIAGPDGLPIRQQVLSGSIVEADLR